VSGESVCSCNLLSDTCGAGERWQELAQHDRYPCTARCRDNVWLEGHGDIYTW